MSELINTQGSKEDFRWQLLTTVSALTLLAVVYGSSEARAADQDADRPTVWIELGGQLQRMTNQQEAFSPPFMAAITQENLLSALNVQKPSAYAIAGEGKISFQPDGGNWVFSAAVQYGRSNAARHVHQQTKNAYVPIRQFNLPAPFSAYHLGGFTAYPDVHVRFSDGTESQSESHAILDFQAGKDVGLGMFGGRGSSILSVGVRFAQFTSKANVTLRAEPDVHYQIKSVSNFTTYRSQFKYVPVQFHDYVGMASNQRNFRGAGPSVSWSGSLPFDGDPERGELTFDWGVNAAILFGRQKAKGHHQTTAQTYHGSRVALGSTRGGNFFGLGKIRQVGFVNPSPHVIYQSADNFDRARSVVVPNLGGTAGLSFRYSNAKISFGYRADFFLGAMDGGIDVRRTEDVGFHGPFATISIGLGG